MLNSLIIKMETKNDMAITKTLHALLINTSVVTLHKRGKKFVYGSLLLFSLAFEKKASAYTVVCIVTWEYLQAN